MPSAANNSSSSSASLEHEGTQDKVNGAVEPATVCVMADDYNENACLQGAACDILASVIAWAVAREGVPLNVSGPLVIADYGASHGANSSVPAIAAAQAFGSLRASSGLPSVDSVLMVQDLPENNFTELLKVTKSALPDSITPVAVGGSFYERVLPRNSLHLGFSSTAMHWLSSPVPALLEGDIFPIQALGSDEAFAFSDRAASDWAQLLRMRSEELVTGGLLVLANLARTDYGKTGSEALYNLMSRTAKNLCAEGVITEKQLHRLTFNDWYRSRAEFEDPVALAAASLVVERHDTEFVRFPMEHATSDPEAFAQKITDYARGWSESTVFSTFSHPASSGSGTEGTAGELTRTFFERVRLSIQENPSAYDSPLFYSFLVLRKV